MPSSPDKVEYSNNWTIPLHLDLNDLPDLEVDRQLARFIGWKPSQIRVTAMWGVQVLFVARTYPIGGNLVGGDVHWWRTFTHKDDEVMWRVCSKNGVFPRRYRPVGFHSYPWSCSSLTMKYTNFGPTSNRAAANLFLELLRRKDYGRL